MNDEKLVRSEEDCGACSEPQVANRRAFNLINLLTKDAVLLTAASAGVYLLTYSFESGVCEHYGIPDEFIVLTISHVLKVASYIAITLLAGLLITLGTVQIFIKEDTYAEWWKNCRSKYPLSSLYMLLLGAILLTVKAYSAGFIYLAIGLLGIIRSGLREYFFRSSPQVAARIRELESRKPERDRMPALPGSVRTGLLVFFAVFAANFVFRAAGTAYASTRGRHAVIEKDNRYLVVARNYDGILYCCPYYPDERTLGCEVVAVRAEGITWRYIQTGHIYKLPCLFKDLTTQPVKPANNSGEK